MPLNKMRKKYKTLDEYRAANARRQREWRKRRMHALGLKPGKRGRKPRQALPSLSATPPVRRRGTKKRQVHVAIA
jgi:hypothetical protein